VKLHSVTVKSLAGLTLQSVHADWLNYQKRGIGPEHVPELIRIATDPAQLQDDWYGELSVAARHAVRALAQLRAMEAVGPLLAFVGVCNDSDWDPMAEELSEALSRFGPAVLPELEVYLANPAHGRDPRVVVADAITNLAMEYPEQRDTCVALLSRQLERSAYQEHDRRLNGMLIDCLLDLEAVEAAPLMEKLFAAGQVDEEIISGWEEAEAILKGTWEEPDDEPDDDDEPRFDYPDRGWSERHWGEQPAPSGKSPKERAQERAKARKKQKKKKK
jgi:hypothetical protein